MTATTNPKTDLPRCPWAGQNQLYRDYHDQEWGRPLVDDHKLFELLCLEGQQAGLSWLTILKKRGGYRLAFHNFKAEKISNFSESDLKRLQENPDIIRNRLKIKSIRQNARAFLAVTRRELFTDFIWKITGHRPLINHWQQMSNVPACSAEAVLLAAKLKKAGFNFVGPTICYAFMQAAGLVNDHLVSCYCHPDFVLNNAYKQ